MRKFSRFTFHFLYARIWKPYALSIKTITGILLFTPLIFQLKSFGQAANIDQIRNSNFYSTNTSDPLWVNGNAGASNSHYTEGMSIAYRALLTGLTAGKTYSIVIGYDTKHSDAMALDYLTHFQRLEPHGPFGHAAEVINPLRMESGSNEYNMAVFTGPFTAPFPVPDPLPPGYWNNADNGSHLEGDDGTPVDDMPKNSFNALNSSASEPNDNVMTIWNGSIIVMNYTLQQSLVTSTSSSSTNLRIKFTANDDSVLFAWGGHIASRLDWGSVNGVPRSAGGISGSPYHMRLEQLFVFNSAPVGNKICNKDSCEVGLGNQDRSLSAAAVVPPPGCNVSGPVKACPETSSLVYSTTVTGVTYLWELLNNTANAKISSGQGTSSITVTPDPDATSANFTPGGIFNVKLTTTSNGINTVCYLGSSQAPGNNVVITDVTLSATATSNVTTTQAGCSAVLDRTIGNTSNLSAVAGGSTATPFTYQWSDGGNPGGSFSDATIANPVYTVTANGTFNITVVATDADGCQEVANLTICVVGATPNCIVAGPSPICPGSTNNYVYDPSGDGNADPIPANFNVAWTLENNTNGASISGTPTGNTATVVSSGGNCNSEYTIKITLTSTSGAITATCSRTVSVVDQTAPTLSGCPGPVTVDFCSIPPPAPVTATDNCPAPGTQVIVTFLETRSNGQNGCTNIITRKWTASDACGNTATCGQTITIVDQDPPLITCPPSVTIKFADNKDDLTKTGAAFVSDNCAIAGGSPTYTDDPASPGGGTTFTRTWLVTDASGNTATCSQSITREAAPVTRLMSTPQTETSAASTSQQSPELKVKAYPNPFTDQVNFRFTPSKSGTAKMELFDMTGRRLSTVQIGHVQAGVERSVNYKVPSLKRVSMFYRIIIGDQAGKGLLISGAKNQ